MVEVTPTDEQRAEAKPREILDAIGELALAIAPHNMNIDQRKRISNAIGVLIDHVIAYRPAP